jgi:hypothetical protein
MGLVGWRAATVLAFLGVSAGAWYALEGYSYRAVLAAMPLLFAAQVCAGDVLEGLLMSKVGFKTKWFTLLIAPGTILHEFCHLLAALVTGCTVTGAALFRPNPQTGVLGFVSYKQPDDKWLVFRSFIVGFAPFFGCGLLLLAANGLLGGGLQAIVGGSAQGVDGLTSFSREILGSALSSVSKIDFSRPAVWVLVYLQLCFTMGAAPSTQDFKGFTSAIWAHWFSAIMFGGFAALIVYASQGQVPLWGYESEASQAIGVGLRFVTAILLLSTALTAILIPVVFAAVRSLELEGIAKTIPLSATYLTWHFASAGLRWEYALAAAVVVFAAAILALGGGAKKKA